MSYLSHCSDFKFHFVKIPRKSNFKWISLQSLQQLLIIFITNYCNFVAVTFYVEVISVDTSDDF